MIFTTTHKLLIFIFFLTFIGNSQARDIAAYFNYNQKNTYSTPYRNILRAGDDLEKVILEELSKAKKTVSIAVQELRLPKIAKKLVSLKEQGVDVRVVLENDYNNTIGDLGFNQFFGEVSDHSQSRYIELFNFIDINNDGKTSRQELEERDAIFILNQSSIGVVDDTADDSLGSGLMHHKFIVIDDRTVIVSTANFTLSGIHGDYSSPSSRGNPNSLVVINSKSLSKIFNQEFNLMWGTSNKSLFGKNKPNRGVQETKVNGTRIKVQFSPSSKSILYSQTVNGLISKEIGKSKSETLMALFVFSEQRIADSLKEKYERIFGYKVGLILEPKFAYRNYSELLDILGIELLDENCELEYKNNPWAIPNMKAGVANLNTSDVLHHKFAVIDEKKVIMGSHNWSASANYNNDENILIIENPNTAQQYKAEYSRLAKNMRQGAPKSLLRRVKLMQDACAF